jgi:glycosyltransferase involved in cell wall biosynthesis
VRVLLLSYCFPPAPMAEGYVTAKTMGAVDAEVDVICAAPSTWAMRPDASLDHYVRERFTSVKYLAPPGGPFATRLQSRAGALGRMPDQLRILNPALRRAVSQLDLQSYDVLVTRSEFHSVHLVGLHVKRREPRLPWIASFSDPWVADTLSPRAPWAERLNARWEAEVLRAADALVYTSPQAVDHVAEQYPHLERSKVAVIPHSFDPTLYPERAAADSSERETVVRFVGTFSSWRPPDPLFAAFKHILDDDSAQLDGLTCEVIGYLDERYLGKLDLRIRQFIRVRPAVDYLTSLASMVSADGLILVDTARPTSLYLPSKLIDYLGANRPIVGLTPPGPAQELLDEIGAFVGHPSSSNGSATALTDFFRAARAGEASAPQSVGSRYTVGAVGAQWNALLQLASRR